MSDSNVDGSDKADSEDVAEDESPAAADSAGTDDDSPRSSDEPRRWTRTSLVAAVLVAAALGGAVFGFIKYREVSGELEQLRQSQADRDSVAELAKDYALKSLNYTFEDPDAFFRAVEDGVSHQLKDKYVNAGELLKAVMLEAQVTSTGEVLATDPVVQPDGSYQVVVSAHQTTRNLQNPTPKVSIILLQVTVHKVGDAWQVADIAPKTGANPPGQQQIPAIAPPAAPAKPTPQR
jgi:Mce-associated membrane protein